MTRVLGVDPGSRYLGVGLVESAPAGLRAIHFGVLNARPSDALELRLKVIFEALETVIAQYRPMAIAVEGVFALLKAVLFLPARVLGGKPSY